MDVRSCAPRLIDAMRVDSLVERSIGGVVTRCVTTWFQSVIREIASGISPPRSPRVWSTFLCKSFVSIQLLENLAN